MPPSFSSSTPVACDNELTSVTEIEDDEQLVDYNSSRKRMNFDINVVHMSADDYAILEEELAHLDFEPREATFQKPKAIDNHLKALYMKGHINGKPISRLLVDGGAIVNLMPYSLFKKLGRSDEELIKTNMTISGVGGGEPIGAKGVVSMELTVESKTLATAFFVVETQDNFSLILGHYFVIVATNYFTKWTEGTPLKNMIHQEVIEFVREHIVHRFGIPRTLTLDQGTSCISKEVREFVESYGTKLLNSSPYYAQANGQAESSNKILIKLIKKKIDENPRRWHEVLSEALWAYCIARHGATKVTPFEIVYGQEAILPVVVNLGAYRLAKQNNLDVDTYHTLMMENVDEVTDKRLEALKEIEKDKILVARAHNKKVKVKSFQVNDLVWKMILPIGTKSNKFGKWSPSWEGPYKIVKVLFRNSYMVETLRG
ncbi:protein NYNRIN-like [Setaria italica]|uniref:protein NYNRIN-like n=1 Tax=Setaria italica TaxID=4555 RepID=UPI00064848F9|nr:protein NYNRIN-like [Setaria italica]